MELPLVLLIDDDEDDLMLLEWAFSRQEWPCQLMTFRDGQSVLTFLKNTSVTPTLILLDHQMPGLSGLEVLNTMREFARYEHTPVIFMSGETPPAFTSQVQQVGENSYFVKPTSIDQWKLVLGQIIGSLPVPINHTPIGKHPDV